VILGAESIAAIRRELRARETAGYFFLTDSRDGFFLTRDDLNSPYAIIRHNIRTYRSAGVIAVVRGKHNAESELKTFEDSQNSYDRHEGWRYFIEKTELKPGTDPVEATEHRQAELEGRESKALQKTESAQSPLPYRRK
jgi:hypothetical protein